jgi:hypothetical protein
VQTMTEARLAEAKDCDILSSTHLLIDLNKKLATQEQRLKKWRKLQADLKQTQTSKTSASVPQSGQTRFRFDMHQSLQLPNGKQFVATTEAIPPDSEIIRDMRTELARLRRPYVHRTSGSKDVKCPPSALYHVHADDNSTDRAAPSVTRTTLEHEGSPDWIAREDSIIEGADRFSDSDEHSQAPTDLSRKSLLHGRSALHPSSLDSLGLHPEDSVTTGNASTIRDEDVQELANRSSTIDISPSAASRIPIEHEVQTADDTDTDVFCPPPAIALAPSLHERTRQSMALLQPVSESSPLLHSTATSTRTSRHGRISMKPKSKPNSRSNLKPNSQHPNRHPPSQLYPVNQFTSSDVPLTPSTFDDASQPDTKDRDDCHRRRRAPSSTLPTTPAPTQTQSKPLPPTNTTTNTTNDDDDDESDYASIFMSRPRVAISPPASSSPILAPTSP